MRNKVLLLFTIIITIIPLSCEDSKLLIDCNKCYNNASNHIEIVVTIDEENPYVPITVYLGTIDKGDVLFEDTTYGPNYYTNEIFFDEQYSAVAKYTRGGRIVYAVDGRTLSKKLDQNSCDNPCYLVYGNLLDLRLK